MSDLSVLEQKALEAFPNVHAAYEVYMKYFDAPPENATQIVKWCKKQGIVDIKYANVNKYLRLKRDHAARHKKKKPVVKSSEPQRIRNPVLQKAGTVSQFSQRFLVAMDESKKSRSTRDFEFDKGQTRSAGFGGITKKFEQIMEEEKKVASASHTAYKKKQEEILEEQVQDRITQLRVEKEAEKELEDVLDDSLVSQLEEIGGELDTQYLSEEIHTDHDFDDSGEPTGSASVASDEPLKPWLRLKPGWSPVARMSKDTPQWQELKEWLDKKKFGQFADKLHDCGVESLNDLRILESEEEVTELAGPQGINMGVVFRRKFIKAVTALRNEGPPPEAPKTASPAVQSPEGKSPEAGAATPSTKKGLTRAEQEALNRLVTTIKDHTGKLRRTRGDLANIKKQAETTRARLGDIFDKAMAVLVLRRKTLEAALDRAEEQTSKEMKQRVQDLQTSAKDLLRCKQAIEQQFKAQQSGAQRESYVRDSVEKALGNVPNDHELRDLIVFEEGEPGLIDYIENYGTIGAARAKSPEQN